ncbi:ATP-binding protein [Stigmatella sp. ncwal1]|uniref:histidine kinase n=1 Tax=Stigmatella ashevillensis TaxID=2995309 RepID=A0ABT5D8L0_9BACT|nr:ATP-binding protein [Stigmatella ashevillena]MDC0708601.1 ATP-binding protein [Stigmatella ashevillena]
MNLSSTLPPRRILVIDDNPSIHQDFQKILTPPAESASLDALESALFGAVPVRSAAPTYPFEVDSASQGEEGLQRVRESVREGQRYAVAFVDVRMPPGMDGVETTARLWEEDEDVQVVLCTAYSDYSWEETRQRLGATQRLLILRKPFDNIEVRQMAHALTEKWELAQQNRCRMKDLNHAVLARTRELEAAHARLRQEMEDRARLEARLAHVQRLEALGRLAAGLAHEVSGPLGFVGVNLSYIREALEALASGKPLEDTADLLEACRDALLGTDRIKHIVQDVKLFARADRKPGTPVDVRRVLEQSISMAGEMLGSRVRLVRDFHEVSPVWASEHGLGQVFHNLLVNATHALPDTHPEPWVRVATRQQGLHVVVEIQDNGSGIAPENLGRIFEPFFTTKPVGLGTGLGLSICHGIITGFGGNITVDSNPGKGTTFRIQLPLPP